MYITESPKLRLNGARVWGRLIRGRWTSNLQALLPFHGDVHRIQENLLGEHSGVVYLRDEQRVETFNLESVGCCGAVLRLDPAECILCCFTGK